MSPARRHADVSPWLQIMTQVDGNAWPPLPTEINAAILALAQQLDYTQYMPYADLQAGQQQQLAALLQHAAAQAPAFAARLTHQDLTVETILKNGLACLKPLRRAELQDAGDDLHCRQILNSHAPWGAISTSGSTGQPVTVRHTNLTQQFWAGFGLRDHLWHRRDLAGTLVAVRSAPDDNTLSPNAITTPDWGLPTSLFFATGPGIVLPATLAIAELTDAIIEAKPDYLLLYPSVLAALLTELEGRALNLPTLREIRTMGEILPPHARDRAVAQLGVTITDHYSADEVGAIALQCPESGLYHTMAESLIVEILNDHDQPCAEGEVGRLVVTALHNYATPLIRYELGDHAEAGPLCACGRTLPTLRRILGRTRNMLVMPDGRRRWLTIDFHLHPELGIRRYQIIQTAVLKFDVGLEVVVPHSTAKQAAVRAHIQRWLDIPDATINLIYSDNIASN